MDLEIKFRKILAEHRQSMTKPRLAVYRALQNNKEPVTLPQLIEQLPDVDKVSVYRTIELFEKIGIAHRVWTGFKSKIELSELLSHHHHHFTCITCGKTTAIKSEALEADLHSFEREYGFRLTYHSVELGGYCAQCGSIYLPTK